MIKDITALADNEVKDGLVKGEIQKQISEIKVFQFEYDVQKTISINLREVLIKYPVPFNLNKKINKMLSHYKGGAK